MKDKEYQNIRVQCDTANELKEIGKKSETYDDLLSRLLKSDGMCLDQAFGKGQEKEGVWKKVSLKFEYNQSDPTQLGHHALVVEGDETSAMFALKEITNRLTAHIQ